MIAKLKENAASLPPKTACLWERWDDLADCFATFTDDGKFDREKDKLLTDIQKSMDNNGKYYPVVINGISRDAATAGSAWLNHLLDLFCESCKKQISEYGIDL